MHLSWILSRYISKIFLRWMLIILGIVIVVIVLFDFTELLRRTSARPEITFHFLLEMLALKIPTLIQQILGFVVLFSGILTFWHLNRHHELEVIRASGVSVWQFIFPILITSLGIACLNLGALNPLAAKMMLRYEHLEDRLFKGHQGSLALSESGLWVREAVGPSQRVYRIQHIHKERQELQGITLYEVDPQDRFLRRLDAEKAQFKAGLLYLKKIEWSEPDKLPEKREALSLPTTLTFDSLQDTGAAPTSLSFWDIPQFAALLEKSGLSSLKYKLHWHVLLANGVGLLVMVILAACCTLRPIRQGGTIFLIISGVTTAFILYFLRDISYALGSSGTLPLLLSAWAPTVLGGLGGLTVLLYFEDG